MATVRTHTRHTRTGDTTTVHRHDRSTRGQSWSQMQSRRRRGLNVRRGFGHLGRAWGYGRRHKRVMACVFGAAGSFELGAWCVSRGLMGVGAAACVLAAALVVPVVWWVRAERKAAGVS